MAAASFDRFVHQDRCILVPVYLLTLYSILSSKLVTFVVGPESKEFTVHNTAVSTLSKPLDRLLNGKMQEAVEGRVIWEDLDEGTFVRFIHWAYTGSYNIPEPDILLDATLVGDGKSHQTGASTTEVTSADVTQPRSLATLSTSGVQTNCPRCQCVWWQGNYKVCSCGRTFANWCAQCQLYGDNVKCPRCIGDQLKKRNVLAKQFTSDSCTTPSGALASPRQNKEEAEDYSQIFLAHARLYVLADKYNVPKLSKLAYQKLWSTLKDFTIYPSRANDVISMIIYTFGAFSESARDNKMCKMLALYAACMFEDLVKCNAFEELINQSPIFTHQMMKMIAERLD